MKPLANMFIAIEDYLADPSRKGLKAMKYLSLQWVSKARQDAKDEFSGKDIGADQYWPILHELILNQAKQAYSSSTRLIQNKNTATDSDPEYILRLSKEQKEKVSNIYRAMRKEKQCVDGVVFAYHGFIERNKSQFDYCDGVEDLIRNHNTSLRLKIRNLQERGYQDAANLLQRAHEAINGLCNHYCQEGANQDALQQQMKDILLEVKANPLIQEHHGVKQLLTNFIFALTILGLVYLAKTCKDRGSFWYRPTTATENLVGDFINDLPSVEPKAY